MDLPLKIFVIIIFASINIVSIYYIVVLYNKCGRHKQPWFPTWFIIIGFLHIMTMFLVYSIADTMGVGNFKYLHDPISISVITVAFTLVYYLIPRIARASSNPESFKVEGFRELAKYYFVLSLSAALYVFWFSLTLYIIITH